MSETSKLGWVVGLPEGEPDKHALARVVEFDHDEFETELYEHFADPEVVALARDQRRFRGQFMRRLRRRRFA